MKVLFVSDSHDRAGKLLAAVTAAKPEGAQAVVHCQDAKGIEAMLAKAREIESRRMQNA